MNIIITLPNSYCRIPRIHILTLSQAQRSPEEEGDYMAFEQLVAEAAAKKEKKKDRSKKGANTHDYSSDAAADAPNVPRAEKSKEGF